MLAGLRRVFMVALLGFGLGLPGSPAVAQTAATVGILKGGAVLVRQSTRYTLAEGVALADGDIVETAAGTFAQIEFADGTLLGVGESGRLLVRPRLTGPKPPAARIYLLEGWVKVRLAKPETRFAILSPLAELEARTGALVVRIQSKAYAAFVEAGAAQIVQRDGARATIPLKNGEFAMQTAGADKPTLSTRLDPGFLQQMPPMFREPLPPRAGVYARRPVAPQPLGLVSYADVAAWLRTEGPLRLGLSRQWPGRASDRQFRADVAANPSSHIEWERVLYPERFLPKPPPDPASARPAASTP